MGRVLKWVLIVVGGLIVLAVAAVAIVLTVVDPNDYRDEISQLVEQRTGRELAIEGDIELSFWPTLGLQLGRTRLADAPGFGDEPFLSLENARLGVAVWPLLSERTLVLDKMVLDGLSLRLIRNAEGVANWEQLVERLSSKSEPEQPAEPRQGGAPAVAIESLGGLEIRGAQLLYEDRQAGQSYLLSPLNVEVEALELGQPMPVAADWVLKAEGQPEVSGRLAAELAYQAQEQRLDVAGLSLDLLARGEQVPGGEQPLSLTGALRADLGQGVYQVPNLTLQAAGLVLKASMQARQQGEALSAEGTLSVPSFNPRDLMRRLAIEAPQTADAKALSALSAEARFRFDGSSLALSELSLTLDDSKLTGSAALASFAPPAVDFKLAMDRLNLDRYLPPVAEGEASPAGGEQPPAELPIEALRKLDLDGAVSIGELIAKGLTITDVKAEVHAKDGRIRLEPASAQLYQGRYQGTARLDVSGGEPRLALDQHIDRVQAGPLLQDLIGDAKLLGQGNLALKAEMTGAGVEQWLNSLNGAGNFKFADGAIAGINLAGMVRGAKARLSGQADAEPQAPSTDFSVLGGSFVITDGILANRDLSLMSPLMRVTGEGKVNLPAQEVDYLVTVNLVKTLEGQGGAELSDLGNIPIPVRIRGGFQDLSYNVDLASALKQSQGARIEEAKARLEAERQAKEAELREKLEQEEERLREKAGEKAGEALRGLLGR